MLRMFVFNPGTVTLRPLGCKRLKGLPVPSCYQGALLIAVPIGLGSAMFLSEYAPAAVRSVVKPILEVLAGIPTVVYGYFALIFVTPKIIQPLVPSADIFNAASAAIVVGIMIVPTIASL